MKSTPATEIPNETVLALIPPTATRVLEIGSGGGPLARELTQRQPGTEYVGVEIDEEYAALSARYCTRVHVDNFERPGWVVIDEVRHADVVIFADVLEHFVDPWKVMAMLRATMRPDARLIASIPNVQHWSIQLRLHRGDFRYADNGLLDRTHLRFFTRETMLELFLHAGFRVETIVPRIFGFPQQDAALQLVSNIAQQLGGDVNQAIHDAAAFQFVLVGVPDGVPAG